VPPRRHVAFCPGPPLLVPQLAQGAAPELADLLAACDTAVSWLVERSRSVVVVGSGGTARTHPDGAAGTLAGFGLAVLAGGTGPAVLPLSLCLGAWLLDRTGADTRRCYVEVTASDPVPPDVPDAAALLVIGDGTARLSERAPGGLDPSAAEHADRVAAALASGNAAALAALDPDEGERLMAAGVPAWRAVGAAVAADPGPVQASLLARSAPYGVDYLVATWQQGPQQ